MITRLNNPIKELDNKVLFEMVRRMSLEEREFFLEDVAGKFLDPSKDLFGDKICSICSRENNLKLGESPSCNSCFYKNYKLF